LSETSSIDCEVHVSTRGRKPKQQLNDETMTKHRRSAGMSEKPKEHEDLALQLNKFYNNVMRKRTKARHNNEVFLFSKMISREPTLLTFFDTKLQTDFFSEPASLVDTPRSTWSPL